MKKLFITPIAFLFVIAGVGSKLFANEDEHEHKPGEKHEHKPEEKDVHDHEKKDEHGHDEKDEHGHEHGKDEPEHDEKDEHGHEEEGENSAIGPDKGILEKGKNGFKLSPEAVINFGITTAKVQNPSQIPPAAIVKVKDEKFVYRFSESWVKKLHLDDVSTGDDLIITGTGFVRTAEIVAEEGMAEGHSH